MPGTSRRNGKITVEETNQKVKKKKKNTQILTKLIASSTRMRQSDHRVLLCVPQQ